jgi:hypothetical protein
MEVDMSGALVQNRLNDDADRTSEGVAMLVEWKEPEQGQVCGWVIASHRTVFGRHMLTVVLPDGSVREVKANDCHVPKFELRKMGVGG